MFLKSAIEKILAERDIRRKENAALKKACETAIGQYAGVRLASASRLSYGALSQYLPTHLS